MVSRGGQVDSALDQRLRRAKVTLCAPRPRPPACRAGLPTPTRPDTAHAAGHRSWRAACDARPARRGAALVRRPRRPLPLRTGLCGTAGGVLTSQRCRAARCDGSRRGDWWLARSLLFVTCAPPVLAIAAQRFGSRSTPWRVVRRQFGCGTNVNHLRHRVRVRQPCALFSLWRLLQTSCRQP